MADPSYLQDEGNLRLLKDGRPIGKMPYFHLFINQGEVARPPEYVELTKEREKGDRGSPEGVFSFYVDDWQEGLLSIQNCKAADDSSPAFLASKPTENAPTLVQNCPTVFQKTHQCAPPRS